MSTSLIYTGFWLRCSVCTTLTKVDLLTPEGMSHMRIQWSIPALSISSSCGHITVDAGCVWPCNVSSGVRVVGLCDLCEGERERVGGREEIRKRKMGER